MAIAKRSPRAFALLAIGCALGALPMLTGCAGSHGATPTRIVGGVYVEGGPMAQHATAAPKNPVSGTATATADDRSAAGRYHASTARDGTFTLDVVPGTYEVAATTSSGLRRQPVEVTVAAGKTAAIELDAHVP